MCRYASPQIRRTQIYAVHAGHRQNLIQIKPALIGFNLHNFQKIIFRRSQIRSFLSKPVAHSPHRALPPHPLIRAVRVCTGCHRKPGCVRIVHKRKNHTVRPHVQNRFEHRRLGGAHPHQSSRACALSRHNVLKNIPSVQRAVLCVHKHKIISGAACHLAQRRLCQCDGKANCKASLFHLLCQPFGPVLHQTSSCLFTLPPRWTFP